MSNYSEQLKDPRWLNRRQEILRRDCHMCQRCMSSHNLQVHHKQYFSGVMAWEYEDWFLITLCDRCHKEEHGLNEFGKPEDQYEKSGRVIRSAVMGILGLMAKMRDKEHG